MKYLNLAKSNGYEINLTFLWLEHPEQAIKRVTQRIKQGGHYVPKETIIRRYYAGIKNLIKIYLPIADSAIIVDSSTKSKKVIAKKLKNQPLKIINKKVWEKLEKEAYGK